MSDSRIVIAPHSRDERARARENTAVRLDRLTQERQKLARSAFDAGWRQRETIGKALWARSGVWWEELAPLEPKERTIVIRELRTVLGLAPE